MGQISAEFDTPALEAFPCPLATLAKYFPQDDK